jgi:hypothetical protein
MDDQLTTLTPRLEAALDQLRLSAAKFTRAVLEHNASRKDVEAGNAGVALAIDLADGALRLMLDHGDGAEPLVAPMTNESVPLALYRDLKASIVASGVIAAAALARLDPEHRSRLMRAVDAEHGELTVQCDHSDGVVHVLLDAPGWLAPQFLLTVAPKPPASN